MLYPVHNKMGAFKFNVTIPEPGATIMLYYKVSNNFRSFPFVMLMQERYLKVFILMRSLASNPNPKFQLSIIRMHLHHLLYVSSRYVHINYDENNNSIKGSHIICKN